MPTTDINRTHLGNQIQWFKILPLETTVFSLAKPAESRSVLVIAGFVSAELPDLGFTPRLFHLLYTVKCQSCWNTDTKAIKTKTYWWLPVPKKCYDTWIPYDYYYHYDCTTVMNYIWLIQYLFFLPCISVSGRFSAILGYHCHLGSQGPSCCRVAFRMRPPNQREAELPVVWRADTVEAAA